MHCIRILPATYDPTKPQAKRRRAFFFSLRIQPKKKPRAACLSFYGGRHSAGLFFLGSFCALLTDRCIGRRQQARRTFARSVFTTNRGEDARTFGPIASGPSLHPADAC